MRHWNRFVRGRDLWNRTGFYPTYEALKPFGFVVSVKNIFCFYPTYEALKSRFQAQYYFNILQFLPYLWGIETYKAFRVML